MQNPLVTAALLFSLSAVATGHPCSIHPKKGSTDSELVALAKVTQADAEGTALKAVANSTAKVKSAELEAEGGCLIYSFDIAIPGKKSITEVTVDAGTGKVLSRKQEGANEQAAEAAADKVAAEKH